MHEYGWTTVDMTRMCLDETSESIDRTSYTTSLTGHRSRTLLDGHFDAFQESRKKKTEAADGGGGDLRLSVVITQ